MFDIITAEIIREYLETVSKEISKTMENTSVSVVFSEAHDYSTGVFHYDGTEVALLSRANSQPIHIYASVTSVEDLLRFFKYNLNEGDIVLATDPYHGGSHIPDWTLMKPVFYRNKPVFFPAVRAHMIDVGGPVPGGYNSFATDIWQEGFRLAPMKICEKGEMRRDVLRMLSANNRVPTVMEGDLNAMIGACKVGEERIIRLVNKYGLDTVLKAIEYILAYSERRVRSEIASWPDGEYVGESILDQDFNGSDDVNVRVRLKVKGDRCTVDLGGSHPQTRGFVNSVAGNTKSWVYTEFSVVMPDVPINSGFFRAIDIHIPEGTVVNPVAPAPVGNSTVCIGSDIGQATMKALEKIVPEKTGSAFIDLTVDCFYGRDSRHDDEMFITFDYSATPTASGGACGTDGWGAFSAPHASLKIPPYELMEIQFPVIYYQGEYVIDTAAPGRWRGSPSHWMQRAATTDPTVNNIYVQAARHPLQGFAGGHPGAGNACVLDYKGPNERSAGGVAFGYLQQQGEILLAKKQGGGGWGDPLERDPEAVLRDVLDEYVSVEGAERDYGVIIDVHNWKVDEAATTQRRTQRRAALKSTAYPEGNTNAA
jgi:N-methylhydantoinase B